MPTTEQIKKDALEFIKRAQIVLDILQTNLDDLKKFYEVKENEN